MTSIFGEYILDKINFSEYAPRQVAGGEGVVKVVVIDLDIMPCPG